tara:strand:+ start:264 stop:1409 length:1146 start_codon:yes stop_codon:yes gene_type:complete
VKILIVHNKYSQLGGEDVAVDNEIELLSDYFNVETIFFKNEIKSYLSQFIYFIRNNNKTSVSELEKKIKEFQPDIAYVHNTWFKASLAIFNVLRKHNIKTLVKLHNFRYDCTRFFLKHNHLKTDHTCPKCGMINKRSSFFNKYFKESFLKSVFMIIYGKKYFKILNRYELKILVLTNFHKKYLTSLGIQSSKIYVSRNPIKMNNKKLDNSKKNYFVYSGRISEEKGVNELINAFLDSNIKDFGLKIVGDGPDLKKLKNKYSKNNIEFLGLIPNKESLKIIENSIAVITATKLYEGQPMLLCEASSLGVPSIFPNFGGISEFFPENNQLAFEQFNYVDLLKKINMFCDSDFINKAGVENKNYIEDKLNSKNLVEQFKSIINE